MDKVRAFIDSGILELYALQLLGDEERQEVEEMAASYPEVAEEINEAQETLELLAQANAETPPPLTKPFLMAAIDYIQRMESGEEPVKAPILTEKSSIDDFRPWLESPDMSLPPDAGDLYTKIIDSTPEQTTAVAWLRTGTPDEIHHDQHEKFLILEGTCKFSVGDDVHKLTAGDFFAIPLHTPHHVDVTSDIPCKAIIQRVAV